MEKVRIVGLSGSPRHGNTEILVKKALERAKKVANVETEFVSLADKKIVSGCINCKGCIINQSYCIIKDDWLTTVKPLIDPIPDGLIVGSPVYFFSCNAKLRAFMERFTCLFKKKWNPDFPFSPPDWTKSVAGAIAVGSDRHGGVEMTLTSMIHWLLTCGFIVVGAYYIGAPAWIFEKDEKNAVLEDQLGLKAAEKLGERITTTARLLKIGQKKR
jgi:multimeric flavodoxin WrbA